MIMITMMTTQTNTNPTKKKASRFSLWKAPKKDFDRPDATWDTPIGIGRPAWHLECSAMAYKYLGPQIDINYYRTNKWNDTENIT